MSPLNKKKLEILRKKLDLLDNDILDLIKKRSNLVNNVLKLKAKKYNPATKKHEIFVEKKLPPHSK